MAFLHLSPTVFPSALSSVRTLGPIQSGLNEASPLQAGVLAAALAIP